MKGEDLLHGAWLSSRVFFVSSGGGITDWAAARREIFAVSDLCGISSLFLIGLSCGAVGVAQM